MHGESRSKVAAVPRHSAVLRRDGRGVPRDRYKDSGRKANAAPRLRDDDGPARVLETRRSEEGGQAKWLRRGIQQYKTTVAILLALGVVELLLAVHF